MQNLKLVLGITLTFCVLTVSITASMVSYQGRLTDNSGNPVPDDDYSISFTIYDDSTGGESKWSEAQTVTSLEGLFSVTLGLIHPISDSVFAGAPRYLGVKVASDAEIEPRTQLNGAPWAFRVATVDSAMGGTIKDDVSISGRLAVGTELDPLMVPLRVIGKSPDDRFVVMSEYDGPSIDWDIAAYSGLSRPNPGYGIGGTFEGGRIGVKGVASQPGVEYNYGVYGEVRNTIGNCYGVYGIAEGEGNNYGVYGTTGGTGGYAVYGTTEDGGGLAGYFDGVVNVTGLLYKAGGTFKIDHPQDPENKYLLHSFVESPDMMNFYNGNIVTDDQGAATVYLPGYFEALNKDFRYQLTVIGEFAQAIVAERISDNRFTIRTDKPRIEVSWQVTGIRKDRFAEANRIQAEIDKPADEKGLYLHPELFGVGPEKDVNRVHWTRKQ